MRHAIEIRHESFLDSAFVRLLRRHRIALVVADTAGLFPYREDISADFVYLRLHGDTQLYASGYSDTALAHWAARVRAWSQGAQPPDANLIVPGRAPSRRPRDVYCYFDNDAKVKAPFDAAQLARHLGLVLPGVPPPESASPLEARRSARRAGLRHRIAMAA